VPLSPGTRLGSYEILEPLGAGGMGQVYRARDTRLKREVALKTLPEAWANDPAFLARLELEAQAASALNHPHIVTIHELGGAAPHLYIVMELVEGESLRSLLTAGGLPVPRLLALAAQVADALAAAHAKGIVHRDLKPDNVVVTKASSGGSRSSWAARHSRRPRRSPTPARTSAWTCWGRCPR
jgi:serine/threonine protein kinase